MIPSNFNPKALEYDRMYENEEIHWWYKGLRDILFYWINKINPNLVLDAGCGTGINSKILQDQGRKVYGIDVSENAVDYCKIRGVSDVSLGSITNIPFANGTFDLIYSCDVLGALTQEEVKQAFSEMLRCLKDKGYLIINTASLQWLFSRHDRAWDIKKRYTKQELTEVLQENGFEVVYSTYRLFVLFIPVMVWKLVNRNKDPNSSDMSNFGTLTNYILTVFMKVENTTLRFISLPVGSSLFVVAQKK